MKNKIIISLMIVSLFLIGIVVADMVISLNTTKTLSKEDKTTLDNYLSSKNIPTTIAPNVTDAVCGEYECVICAKQMGIPLQCYGLTRYKYIGTGTEVTKSIEKTPTELRAEYDDIVLQQLKDYAIELREVKENKTTSGSLVVISK